MVPLPSPGELWAEYTTPAISALAKLIQVSQGLWERECSGGKVTAGGTSSLLFKGI